MSQIKEKVRNYLKTDRSMVQGIVLYQSLPGRNLAFANQISRMPDTERSRNQLYYELVKLAGISEGEKNSLLAQRIHVKSKADGDVSLSSSAGSGSVSKAVDRFDAMKWPALKKAAGELPEEFQPKGKKKKDVLAALRAYEAQKNADVSLSASAESGSVSKAERTNPEEESNEVDPFSSMEWNDIKKAAAALPEDFAPNGKKKEDLLQALRNHAAHLEAQKKKAENSPGKESSSETSSPSSAKDPAPQSSSSS